MEAENVTGICYLDEDLRPARNVAWIILAFLSVFFLVASALTHEPGFLIVELVPLLILGLFLYSKRFGLDPDATYELSQGCVQTVSKSKKMRRRISWADTSVIQIARMEGTRATPPMDYYVFVRGRDNALIKCRAMETYAHFYANPNRIAIRKSAKTEPFVTAIAEKYGIPVEYSQLK